VAQLVRMPASDACRFADELELAIEISGIDRRAKTRREDEAALDPLVTQVLPQLGLGLLMLAEGVPLQVVADVLGHASIRMTADVYGHVLPPARRAAADAMTRALFVASEPDDDGQGAMSSDAT
jgi:integrase